MRLRDEDGAALLLALGFLLFFGLVIGALLTFSQASVLATERLREQRSTAYAADAATDAAIQVGRADPSIGAFGAVPCMHSSGFTSTASTSDGTVATVTCASTTEPLNPDRTVTYTTTVGGQSVIVATVIYHDGVAGPGGMPGVDVISWTYCGHDPSACS